MSEDTAQIARNTISGDFFATKYITPASYAYFPHIINHPDYIRYPFIILIDSVLFLIGPKSAATIKIFNGFLFLVNGILVFFIALNLLERKKDCKLSLDVKNWLAAVTAILASLLIDNYLQYTLSDAYEIPTITVLLLLILTVITIQSPALSGALQAILYLCRPNMIVFAPFIWIYQISEEKNIRKRLRVTLFFAGTFILILTPFIIRNFILTGKLMFSYQQLFELYKKRNSKPS
jgi:chromate transport protein ChrA